MNTRRITLCLVMMMFCIISNAQGPLAKALENLKTEPLPYTGGAPKYIQYAHIPKDFYGKYYPRYTDRNLDKTEKWDTDFDARRLYRIPASDYFLVHVSYGYITGTDVLFLTNSSAQILDKLEAFIVPEVDMRVKEYTIDEDGIITTYQIIPSVRVTEPKSDVLSHRQDVSYRVIDGKFIKIKTVDYEERVYTYREMIGLTDKKHIWDGTETVSKVTEY